MSNELFLSQAAERLGVSAERVAQLCAKGKIPSRRVGDAILIDVYDLEVFEAQRAADRAELADRFAHQAETEQGALGEVISAMEKINQRRRASGGDA